MAAPGPGVKHYACMKHHAERVDPVPLDGSNERAKRANGNQVEGCAQKRLIDRADFSQVVAGRQGNEDAQERVHRTHCRYKDGVHVRHLAPQGMPL